MDPLGRRAAPPRRRAAKRRAKPRTWDAWASLTPNLHPIIMEVFPSRLLAERDVLNPTRKAIRVRITELLPARRKAPR